MSTQRIDTFQNRLRKAMQIRQITAIELAKKTGYNKANISQWVNGVYEAKQDGVYKLALALDVSEAWLMGYDMSMERITQNEREAKLKEWDKKHNPDTKLAAETKEFERILKSIPLYNLPVSAGTGAWLGEGREYEFAFLDEIPDNADFALKVRGDSMQPMYADSDIVFVKANVMVESGQIGVFYLNDEGYMKMLQGNKLISLNEKYKPVVVKEFDSFFCAGRVVGKATSVQDGSILVQD